jgi:hypothetical protein
MAINPQILDIEDAAAVDAAIGHMRNQAVIVQLPTVFALFAAPNRDGVAMIDAAKDRKPGKNYGTTAGGIEHFFGMSSNTSALATAVRQSRADHHSRRALLHRITSSRSIHVSRWSSSETASNPCSSQPSRFTLSGGRLTPP